VVQRMALMTINIALSGTGFGLRYQNIHLQISRINLAIKQQTLQ